MLLVAFTGSVSAQSNTHQEFFHFITKNFKISDSLKYDCNWNYAVILLKTNKQGVITSYRVINNTAAEMKNAFSFLPGYRFPKSMKVDGKSVAFYYSINNEQVCIPKPEDRPLRPDVVVNLIMQDLRRVLKIEPQAIILPEINSQVYLPKQE